MSDRAAESTSGAGQRVCPQCGAPNPPGAVHCASCGTPLAGEGTLIDVTGGEPRYMTPEEIRRHEGEDTGSWPSTFPGEWQQVRQRVYVSRGGRGCLITLVVLALLACCACVLVWQGVVSLF